MITIHQAQKDIAAWITSSQNQYHIATCQQVIDTFLTTKIYKVDEPIITQVKAELTTMLQAKVAELHQQSMDADSAYEANTWHNENN